MSEARTTPMLNIGGYKYVESDYDRTQVGFDAVCRQCSFGGLGQTRKCSEAITKSPAIFGDDCATRDVVYVRVIPAAARGESK